MPMTQDKLSARRDAALTTPSDLGPEAVKHISGALNVLLADVFALYLKTKNFHWHMSGPHFRDLSPVAGRAWRPDFCDDRPHRRARAQAWGLRSDRSVTLPACNGSATTTRNMWTRSTCSPNCAKTTVRCLASMREAHDLCDEESDVATASLLEVWIDETERRIWFLFEIGRAS